MTLLSCFQIGEGENKRLVFVNAGTPDNQASAQEPVQDSALKTEAQRLEVEKIETEAGEDISTSQIIQRLTQIRGLRQSGQGAELRQKIMEWYGAHPTYGTTAPGYIAALGAGQVTSQVIDQIRTDELARFRTLCDATGQAEYDEITRANPTPTFAAAFAALTGGAMLPGTLGTETQALLNRMNINLAAPNENSAIQYLRVSRQKQDLEQQLETARGGLHSAEADLERHRQSKAQIDEQRRTWRNRLTGWMGPIAKWAGIAYGGAVGLAAGKGLLSGLWAAGGVQTGELGVFGSALWGKGSIFSLSTVLKPIASIFTLKGAAVLAGGGALAAAAYYINPRDLGRRYEYWQEERRLQAEVERQERLIGVEGLQLQINQAEKTREGYRQENASRVAQLNAQRKKMEDAKNVPGTTAAQQTAIDQSIAQLKTMTLLFRVSEGDYAPQITTPGAITNPYIINNLRAIGVDEDDDRYPAYQALSNRQDQQNSSLNQKTLQTIAMEGSVEKELPQLTAAEETAVRNFLGTPNAANFAAVLIPGFIRKAPRLAAAIRSMNDLGATNVWRVRMLRSFLQTMDDRELSVAQSVSLATLQEMETDNKTTSQRIRRQPNLLVAFATAQNVAAPGTYLTVPSAPGAGENFLSWIKRLPGNELQAAQTILEGVRSFSVNAAGNLVDLMTPVRTAIQTIFNPGLQAVLRTELDNNPNQVLTDAAKALLKKSSVNYELPDGLGSFTNSIDQVSDPKKLQEIRQLMEEIQRGAYVEGGRVLFVTIEDLDTHFGKIKDTDLVRSISSNVASLNFLVLPSTGIATPTGAGANIAYSSWKQTATVDQRRILAEKLLNAEHWYLQNRITNLFPGFDADTQAALNAPTIATARTHLRTASRVAGIRGANYQFLPDIGTFPNYFRERVEGITNITHLKRLLTLVETMQSTGCRYNNPGGGVAASWTI